MTEEPKVGETWIGTLTKREKTILFIGDKILLFRQEDGKEFTYDKHLWSKYHTRAPVKQKRWINIYPESNSKSVYSTKDKADKLAVNLRIACIEVEFVEGQGL